GEILAAGARLPAITLKDQNDSAAIIDDSLRCLLLTRDMEAGRIVKETLERDGGGRCLRTAAAVYVCGIAALPGFVSKTLALPPLKKRPYPVLLDHDGKQTATIPSQEGKVTVLRLESGVVRRIDYAGSTDELRALAPAAMPAGEQSRTPPGDAPSAP